MEVYKIVTLKDPVTGEKLLPRIPQGLQYEVIGDEITPPIDITFGDVSTLEGHQASDFLLTADASNTYALKAHTHDIEDVSGLQTELDSLKTSVSEGKSLIAAAVTDKGVQTAADATFQQMATNIAAIPTGNCIYGKSSNISVQSLFDDQKYNYLQITITNDLITTKFNRVIVIFNVSNLNMQEQQGCLFYSTKKSSYAYEYTDGRTLYNATFTANIQAGKIVFTSNKVYSAGGANPYFPSTISPYAWFAYSE